MKRRLLRALGAVGILSVLVLLVFPLAFAQTPAPTPAASASWGPDDLVMIIDALSRMWDRLLALVTALGLLYGLWKGRQMEKAMALNTKITDEGRVAVEEVKSAVAQHTVALNENTGITSKTSSDVSEIKGAVQAISSGDSGPRPAVVINQAAASDGKAGQ